MKTPVLVQTPSGTGIPLPSPTAKTRLASSADQAWRYVSGFRSPRIPWMGMLIAGGIHAGMIFGFNFEKVEAPKEVYVAPTIALIDIPKMEEEPEIIEMGEGDVQEMEASAYVPMQADLPSVADVSSPFVQTIDPSAMMEKPNLDAAKVVSIPTGIRGGHGTSGTGLGNVFSLAQLDRIPEPTFQPPPVFPPAKKRDTTEARVEVEFIVDATGAVQDAHVVRATVDGFEDAAVIAVSRWKFRPGMKAGKKVNTRMRQPLLFRVTDEG